MPCREVVDITALPSSNDAMLPSRWSPTSRPVRYGARSASSVSCAPGLRSRASTAGPRTERSPRTAASGCTRNSCVTVGQPAGRLPSGCSSSIAAAAGCPTTTSCRSCRRSSTSTTSRAFQRSHGSPPTARTAWRKPSGEPVGACGGRANSGSRPNACAGPTSSSKPSCARRRQRARTLADEGRGSRCRCHGRHACRLRRPRQPMVGTPSRPPDARLASASRARTDDRRRRSLTADHAQVAPTRSLRTSLRHARGPAARAVGVSSGVCLRRGASRTRTGARFTGSGRHGYDLLMLLPSANHVLAIEVTGTPPARDIGDGPLWVVGSDDQPRRRG